LAGELRLVAAYLRDEPLGGERFARDQVSGPALRRGSERHMEASSRGPAKTYALSGRAGSESRAWSAADVSGTSRLERCVLVPRTVRTRRLRSTSRRSTFAHTAGRIPVLALK
jgi:hypothetical protein